MTLKYTEDGNPVFADCAAHCVKSEKGWLIFIPTKDFPALKKEYGSDLRINAPLQYLRPSEQPGFDYEVVEIYDVDSIEN